MKRVGLLIVAVCIFFSSAWADGTKQFMPNQGDYGNPQPLGKCYLSIAAQEGGSTSGNPSRNFARYYYPEAPTYDAQGNRTDNTGSCDTANALYINIRDAEHEVIHFGLGKAMEVGGTTNKNANIFVRIKDPCGNVVWPLDGSGNPIEAGVSLATLKSDNLYKEYGNITSYAQAYYGPKSIDANGYEYFSIKPNTTNCNFSGIEDLKCNYRIEFSNGEKLSKAKVLQTYLDYFDVTVVNTENCTTDATGRITSGTGTPKEGRLWSYAWGLNTNGSSNQTHTIFYTMSNDYYVSKVYLNGWEPYQFVIACNSFGSQKTGQVDVDRKSKKPATDPSSTLPEYRVFLTEPLQTEWGVAHIPNVPSKLTFAGDAMTCEDLIFVVKLLFNENATIELYMDTNGDNVVDKTIAALLQANVIKNRGFHYPWKDQTDLKETGLGKYYYTPSNTDGCARHYTLSLFNQTYSYEYTDEGTPKRDTINPGDTIKHISPKSTTVKRTEDGHTEEDSTVYYFDDADFTILDQIGSEKNPILINNEEQLYALYQAFNNIAISGADDKFSYTIDNFYVYEDTENNIKVNQPRTFVFDVTDTEGFKDYYFYLTAPTGTIELDDNWFGIGTELYPFKGTFRAGRYNPDPTIERSASTNALSGDQDTITINGTHGLFAFCEDATIENIHIKGNINCADSDDASQWGGYSIIGGICDFAYNTSFSHCTNDCDITYGDNTESDAYVGGILGLGWGCTIDSCYNYGNITTQETSGMGGIVGYLYIGTINYCYNLGIIKSQNNAAGIAGNIQNINITNCRNDGSIIAEKNAAGIYYISTNEDSEDIVSVQNSVNYGNLSGNKVGGITTDNNRSDTEISFCMNAGYLDGEVNTYSIAQNPCYIYHSISTNPAEYINASSSCSPSTFEPTPITETNKASIFASLVGYTEEEHIGEVTVVDHYETIILEYETIKLDEGEDTERDSIVVTRDTIIAVYKTIPDTTYTIHEISGMEDSPFMLDAKGDIKNVTTSCCGQMLRQEDAGRVFDSKTTFYIKWDGKDGDGECVTGDVTVKYQKNSGVTHFPFYDPENNKDGNGLIVYRISPITGDTITAPPLSDSDLSEKNEYGYQKLPKDYYQTSSYSNERGIELKLFWDDTDISLGTTDCTTPKYGANKVGETKMKSETKSVCTSYKSKSCQTTATIYDYATKKSVKYCKTFKSGKTELENCITYQTVQPSATSKTCTGISNVDTGGYYGSTRGGHLFPCSNFGNTNIMNTWWNGVEVKQMIPLKLEEHKPAQLQNDVGWGTTLPIIISLWEATNLEKSVLLEWSTASEENNDYFTIERSTNGVSWVAIGKVSGAGTTSMTNYYSFEDKKPVGGISYYRLKQTDYNGEYSYSSVKCINRPDNANDSFTVYTNKNMNAFVVEGDVVAACPIEIYNTVGERIYNVSFNPVSVNKVFINVQNLPVGTYFVKICNGSKAVVKNW